MLPESEWTAVQSVPAIALEYAVMPSATGWNVDLVAPQVIDVQGDVQADVQVDVVPEEPHWAYVKGPDRSFMPLQARVDTGNAPRASLDELLQLVREVHADVRALREEMQTLRSEVERAPRAGGGAFGRSDARSNRLPADNQAR
jgi:hypothetical protein